MQVLEAALAEGKPPNTRPLTALTRVKGFPEGAAIVAVAAGYQVWLALAADGRVFTCDTGMDGYAGLLPHTVSRGGWHKVNEVRRVTRHTPTSS